MNRRPTILAAVSILAFTAGCQEPEPEPEAQTPAGEPPSEVLLVSGGHVLTMDADSTVLEDGAVAITGERIVAVGSAAELAARYPDARVLDATGKAVLPGLINTHTHVPMTLLRGIGDDLELMEWLEKVIFPAEAANVDEEFVRWGTRLACLEMIAGGTTTFVDMYYFEDAVADEAARCGMRAIVGETLIDFPAPDNPTWDEAVAYTERFLETWKGHPLITPAVAPHAPYTVSAEHLRLAHELAARHDVPFLIHLAESPSEVERIQELAATTPVTYADGLGLLDERTLAAHMVLPTSDEIATLAARGVGVAHCPQSNMKVVAGVAPVPQMLAAGVAVGLGTDGAASNNDLDLWEEIDTAAKLHKVTLRDPTVVAAGEALKLATIGGARATHMEADIGSLEAGKRADLIVVGLDNPRQQPLYDLESVLVYATKASDVETVVINGRIVYEDKRYLTLDPAPVLAKATEYRDRILKTLPR